jgi:hypothetical protein
MTISKTKFHQNDTRHYSCKHVTPLKDIHQSDATKWHVSKQKFTDMALGITTLANMSHLLKTFAIMTQHNDTQQKNIIPE